MAPIRTEARLRLNFAPEYEPFGEIKGWSWNYASTGAQAVTRVFDSAGRLVRYPLADFTRNVSHDAATVSMR